MARRVVFSTALSRAAAALAIVATTAFVDPASAQTTEQRFQSWVREFRVDALAAGVPGAVFDEAFRGVSLSDRVLELDSSQPEFTLPIWVYLERAVSDPRVNNGRAALRRFEALLADIEARYRVPSEVVTAIWGVESNFGSNRGDFDIIAAMATLAHEGRRRQLYRTQLLAALRILARGDVSARGMVGSWAGAMGHTQFMPTSYLDLAVDHDSDGRRDIWSDDPTDALASTANYLAERGWRPGEPWGFHVLLPADFDYALLGGRRRSTAEWIALGLRQADGSQLPGGFDQAELILPAGASGPAFLTLPNFRVILTYNNATSYALAVSLLSEQIAGADPRPLDWPVGDPPLSRSEAQELQELLTEIGYDTGGVDGLIGPNSRSAIRRFQTDNGATPDGYASSGLLAAVRAAASGESAPAPAQREAVLGGVDDGPLGEADIRVMQAFLSALGLYEGDVDGRVGPQTRRAIAAFVEGSDGELAPEPNRALLDALLAAVRSGG